MGGSVIGCRLPTKNISAPAAGPFGNPNAVGCFAVNCRIFHCKLSDISLLTAGHFIVDSGIFHCKLLEISL